MIIKLLNILKIYRAINSKAPKKVLEAKIRKKKRLEKKMKRTNK